MKIMIQASGILIFLIAYVSINAQSFTPYHVDIPNIERSILMSTVNGGQFDMKREEDKKRRVEVDDFWMASFEITWEQYEAFLYRDKEKEKGKYVSAEQLDALGIDGISSATMPYVDMSFGMGKEGYPVINVTQHAALMFCKWLSALTGDFYRLPTEAEWEYVCKLGKGSKDNAVIDKDAYEKVGSRDANALGIYDLLGNVSEWTLDGYREFEHSEFVLHNPWTVPEKLYSRVVKGGSWRSKADESGCSSRIVSDPKWKRIDPQLPKSRWWFTNAPFVGFRIVRPREQPSKAEIQKFWLKVIDDYE